MTYIGIDTNIWIYLANAGLQEVWDKLVEMVDKGEVKIFINAAILNEWERNKVGTIKSLQLNIQNEFKSAKKLAAYLPDEEKDEFLEAVSKYKEESSRIEKAKTQVEKVEHFMKNKCTIVPITDEQKLFIAELAIHNKPPFQNRKNNYNDALILRSIAEYIQKNNYVLHDLIYVSNNPDDFMDKSTKKIHVDLMVGLESIRVTNLTELGQALQMAPGLVDEIDEWLEQQLDDDAMYQFDIRRGK